MKFSFNKELTAVSVAALLAMTSQANAGLIKSGDLIYDDVNEITWFADIHAKSDWSTADNWASALIVNSISGWSLPDVATGLLLEAQDEVLFTYLSGAPTNTPKFWSSETFTTGGGLFKGHWFQFDDTTNNVKATDLNKYAFAVMSGDVSGIGNVDATVPEPSTMAIFSLGLAGLAYRRKQLQAGKKG